MPPRWNARTHLQNVQFDYEKRPKMRQVRLCSTAQETRTRTRHSTGVTAGVHESSSR